MMALKKISLLLILLLLLINFNSVSYAVEDVYEAYEIEIPDKLMTAPNFSLQNTTGGELNLADFKGKIVLVNFWATWCIQCIRELPHFQKLQESLGSEKFEVVAINVMEPIKRVNKFLKSKPYSFKFLLDTKGKIYKKYGVKVFPTTFILDKKSRFIGKIVGDRNWTDPLLVSFFTKIIAEENS